MGLFSRQKGKGNILDPAGIFSGGSLDDIGRNSADPLGIGYADKGLNFKERAGEVLDPFGMGYANPNQSVQKNSMEMLDPFGTGFNKKKDNESMDQYYGRGLDPANLFGQKQRTNYLGPSRISMNVDKYNAEQSMYPQFSGVNPGEQSEPFGFESSYAKMARRP